jgi:hypothetical protein
MLMRRSGSVKRALFHNICVAKPVLRKNIDEKARAKERRGKGRLTAKRRALIKALVKNPDLTLKEAGRIAGYGANSHSQKAREKAQIVGADTALRSPNTRAAFLEAFAANPNLANSKLAQKIAEGLDAMVTKPFAHEGHVVEEKTYVDYPTRATYLALAAKLGGIEPNRIELTGANGKDLNPPTPALDPALQTLLAKLSKEELIAVLSGPSAALSVLPSIKAEGNEGA